jgi:hypothetical protein
MSQHDDEQDRIKLVQDKTKQVTDLARTNST